MRLTVWNPHLNVLEFPYVRNYFFSRMEIYFLTCVGFLLTVKKISSQMTKIRTKVQGEYILHAVLFYA
jgi:hypothetical protein